MAVASYVARKVPVPTVSRYTQLTRDGRPKWLVGTDRARLYLGTGNYTSPGLAQVPVEGGDPVPIPLPASGVSPLDVSADGSQVLLADYYPGRLWSFPISGGKPRRLGVASGNDAAWSPDGKRLAYCNDNNLFVADGEGMGSRKIASVPSRRIFGLRWSPDGTRIRFTNWEKTPNAPSLWEVSSDGSGLRALLPGWHETPDEENGRWTLDGKYYVFQSQGQIWALPERAGWSGKGSAPVQLTNSPLNLITPVPAKEGNKLFVVGRNLRGELVRYDPATAKFLPYLSGKSAEYASFSADGRWVAYITYPNPALWRSRTDGSERLQLTDRTLRPALPRWSPDGKRIAFFDMTKGRLFRSYIVPSAGGDPQLVYKEAPEGLAEPGWFPDGKRLVLSLDRPRGASEIRVLNLESGELSTIAGSRGTYGGSVSPDGRYLVAMRKEPISLTLYDFEKHTWSELARVTGGFPNWSKDGKYVYCLRFPDNPAVLRIRISDQKIETVADLSNLPLTGQMGCWLGLAPDGSPLLLRDTGTQNVYALDWDAR